MTMAAPLVALITAGTAGLGAATARLFAKNGIRVVVNYSSNAERAEDLVKELQAVSTVQSEEGRTDYHTVKADLSKRDDIRRLVEDSVAAMGRLDIVFSNGGWTRLRDINDLDDNVDEEDWDLCFNMNVKSHLWVMHAAKKYLDETEGAFITTASFAGIKVSGSSLVRLFPHSNVTVMVVNGLS
jgi:NAD(P)-dependent dehydrogenase (short-subunit alcohol dehydrogenase family)